MPKLHPELFLWRIYQHKSNGGGHSGIFPNTKLSAMKACMSCSLHVKVCLSSATFDGFATDDVVPISDFCRVEIKVCVNCPSLQ